ncbi:hypothetical protein PUR58_00070, partial [Streptomyces sp. JV186]|nr:hypothetical protein [Streptomyces sp. JV186]
TSEERRAARPELSPADALALRGLGARSLDGDLRLDTGSRAAADPLNGPRVPPAYSGPGLAPAAPAAPPTGSAPGLAAARSGRVAWSAALSVVDPSRAPRGR